MAGIIESFRQGLEGRDSGRFTVGEGTVAHCSQCGGEYFDTASALLNTRGMTFIGFDFADRGASLLVCRTCSHVEWFVEEPRGI